MQARIVRFGQIVRGEIHYSDVLNESDARSTINMLHGQTKIDSSKILKGDFSTSSTFLNAYDGVTYAASMFQTGLNDTKATKNAVEMVTNPDSAAALLRLAGNQGTKDAAGQAIGGARRAARRLMDLSVAQAQEALKQDPTGAWEISRQANGQYQIVLNREKYAQWFSANNNTAIGAAMVPGGPPLTLGQDVPMTDADYQMAVRRGFASAQLALGTANKAFRFLTNTELARNDALEPLPAGVTSAQLADNLANGTPLPGQDKVGPATDVSGFEKQLGDIRARLADLPNEVANHPAIRLDLPAGAEHYGSIADTEATNDGLNPAFIRGMIQIESSWDPKADAHVHFPNSHAYGLMQIQPGTATHLGFKPEDRLDPQKNVQMGTKYISQLIAKHNGDVAAALREFSGGSYTQAQIDQLVRIGAFPQQASR